MVSCLLRTLLATRRGLLRTPKPLAKSAGMRMQYQMRPGSRVVTSWTSHILPSGSLKEKNDP